MRFQFNPARNARLLLAACVLISCPHVLRAQNPNPNAPVNLALAATLSSSFVSSDTSLAALNDGVTPRNSRDNQRGSYGNWPSTGTQWVEYDWSRPISTKQIEVYWWNDQQGVRLPKASLLKYWNGTAFVEATITNGLGVAGNQFNVATFDEITTTKLRLEMDGDGANSTGILEWRVWDSGKSPEFPPMVSAGVDRDAVTGGKTYLTGSLKFLKPGQSSKVSWSKDSGPGKVEFADASAPKTTATFSEPGDYVLKLAAGEGDLNSSVTVHAKVTAPPPAARLDVVYTTPYKIDSPLWNARVKALIVNWIPHCIDKINDPNLPEGGINNFIDAAAALRGETLTEGQGHRGFVFANAWVHQTVEYMCIALMVDPQGDKDIIAAQDKMKATLNDWIPKILAAQMPDGYLQTAFEMRRVVRRLPDGSYRYDNGPFEHWTQRGDHEGYTAGYFIESAINDYTLTGGADKRLYNAAKKLADCWVANLGPGKKEWYDGHEEMEQALVRFGRFVNDMEGQGHGDSYIALAKFLLDCRGQHGGGDYDQTQSPVTQQYEAAGHAVRAAYLYSGMADVAAETHNPDYQSAVLSLWDNLVNKKYYLTGGIGSGDTSEGFGGDYALRNNAYCESCSSCGEIFFQWKMNLAYHDAKYADLYEETMYNALLGSTDLDGKNFYYDNPLTASRARYAWHNCPCCVGNIPRTLLMVPTWTYVKADSGQAVSRHIILPPKQATQLMTRTGPGTSSGGIYVNLFIGSTINVGKVAGTDVQMVQKTDYPWSGAVAITVNPKVSKQFTVYVRVPDRTTSALYTPAPQVSGFKSLTVNGEKISPKMENGYAAITRDWKAGDTIALELPMEVQVVKASDKIAADHGLVALRYGPLIYNVERADQPNINLALGSAPLKPEWRGDLLGGVMVIKGQWADGSPLLAIPNFARENRISQETNRGPGPDSVVWFKAQ